MIPSRIKRVEELVKETVAVIIHREIKDPRLEFVTITAAHVSPDLRNAIIYYTIHQDTSDHKKTVQTTLESAAGFIRRELGRLAVLRYLPVLNFVFDEAFREGARIDSLLSKIHDEEQSKPGEPEE